MPAPKHPTDEKIAWLAEWLKHPENQGATTAQIQKVLHEQFQETIGSRRLTLTLQAARGGLRASAPPLTNLTEQLQATPTNNILGAIRAAMEASGIVAIRLSPTGQIEVTLRP